MREELEYLPNGDLPTTADNIMKATRNARAALDDDRRLRILHLPERRLMEILRGEVRIAELPQGLRVMWCFHDNYSRGIGVAVQHESFEVVPDGHTIPPANPLRFEAIDQETGPKISFRELL